MASPLFMLRGAFRHPERSEMSDVRSCKGGTVRTESKDPAPHHHFAFLISSFSFNRGFHPQSRGVTPHGLSLNLEPDLSFAAADAGVDGQDDIRHIGEVAALQHFDEGCDIAVRRGTETEAL